MIRQSFAVSAAVSAAMLFFSACKPPPTDVDLRGGAPTSEPTYASSPLPSPDTEGAVWKVSPLSENRLLYGKPGAPALMALECLDAKTAPEPLMEISRLSPADEGAGALLALVGNGHIGRISVDANVNDRPGWHGTVEASDTVWEPLAGPRQLTATVPGAGMVVLNPSPLPGELIDACRTGEPLPNELSDEADLKPAR